MTIDVTTPAGPGAVAPVSGGRRILAPDLARGAMLLLIALANAAGCSWPPYPGWIRHRTASNGSGTSCSSSSCTPAPCRCSR